jgi:hypothetical protein
VSYFNVLLNNIQVDISFNDYYLLNANFIKLIRDEKGRFIKRIQPIIPLNEDVKNRLIGELLGDGSLRFTHKDIKGKT